MRRLCLCQRKRCRRRRWLRRPPKWTPRCRKPRSIARLQATGTVRTTSRRQSTELGGSTAGASRQTAHQHGMERPGRKQQLTQSSPQLQVDSIWSLIARRKDCRRLHACGAHADKLRDGVGHPAGCGAVGGGGGHCDGRPFPDGQLEHVDRALV